MAFPRFWFIVGRAWAMAYIRRAPAATAKQCLKQALVIPREGGVSSTLRRSLLTTLLVFTGSSAFADDDGRV
jgi:hypothetical protein